jgi:hypothetical protein
VRLGTCIALELAVVASAISGVFIGVGHTVDLAGDYVSTRAEAAVSVRPNGSTLGRLPSGSLTVMHAEPPQNVFGASDAALLEPIGTSPITRVKINHGGTSLSLRVDFANGARASFKPEQIHPQSDPRREIAAFRIDRLLGVGRVAPAKPIKLTVADVIAAADPALRTYVTTRVSEEARAHNGELRGMAAWWIPEIKDAKLNGLHMHEPEAMQQLLAYLQIGAVIPPHHKHLVDQLALCLVFDTIIDNADRWSGSNTKISPDLKTLYFMDNTLSFSRYDRGHDKNMGFLRRMQVFPRGIVTRLRHMTLESVIAALDLGDDSVGLGPLLKPDEVRAILARRDHVLAHIDQLIAKHGEDAVLALP